MFEGNAIGTTPCSVSMPVTATAVNHGSVFKPSIVTTVKPWELQFIKDGVTENVSVDPSAVPVQNGQSIYNYVFTNAAYMYDPTIMAGEADNMVSRDNPGQTALERTIIRWYFDSDPRGARVFWRVVSSIPQVVKNTNEQYLGTTPFEETRAFNILGLTYENSRDVQIEVKMSRNGYMDQVKRFNVRQAIDQQEISSFFDLVKDEE
ncbi:MAG TPA: hypothetical protein IAC04_07695 [Candidatus Coprenecus stercoravium]|uniref:Uncharacterized protein n=1 Tax=Candidatus Coprenecus stercoravium TaxID=2840735 RepID=A0A9D2GQD2_9BACT|nr:hypothetical protein [Candidatus Coprenecus stercoravium]